jgi:hypothetical protein
MLRRIDAVGRELCWAGRISHKEQRRVDLRKGEEGKVGIRWGEEEVERGRRLRRKG